MGEALDLGPIEVNEFAEFWQAYPRHKDRARAEIAYWRARHVATAAEILSAARTYAASVAGNPSDRTRWAVEWLRAEPWKPLPAVLPPHPRRASRRPRRDPLKPRRAPHSVTRVRSVTAEEQKSRWCRERGITVAEYEARKRDANWLDHMKEQNLGALQ